MDRKHLFKHKTASAKNAREKRRHERQEAQRKKRDATLRGKRMRRNTVNSKEEEYTPEQITEATQKLMSDVESKSATMLESLKVLRRALSLGTAIIDAFLSVEGSLDCLIGIMANSSEAGSQVEAAWCLNNLSAGTNSQAKVVIDAAGQALVDGLNSGNVPLEDQCAWAVGNLAGGDDDCRKRLKDLGAVEPLVGLLKSPISSVVHCAAFALSNLARNKETTTVLTDAGILPHLASLLVYEKGRLDILSEVSWVLTYLTASGAHEAEVVKAGILAKVLSLVVEFVEKDVENVLVLTPLLRCLGNIICSGLDLTGTEACAQKDLFPALEKLLSSDHQHVRKECLWVLSNITSLHEASKEIVDSGLVKPIAALLSATYDVKREAAYTLCNIASHGAELCAELLSADVLPAMIPLLKASDTDTVHHSLSFCEMIMQNTEEGVNTFKEHGGLEGLEGLEYIENESLRAQADNILEVFFYKEDKELLQDVENEAKEVTETNAPGELV